MFAKLVGGLIVAVALAATVAWSGSLAVEAKPRDQDNGVRVDKGPCCPWEQCCKGNWRPCCRK
jgi:hypothetical protein